MVRDADETRTVPPCDELEEYLNVRLLCGVKLCTVL